MDAMIVSQAGSYIASVVRMKIGQWAQGTTETQLSPDGTEASNLHDEADVWAA